MGKNRRDRRGADYGHLKEVLERIDFQHQRAFIVLNKADLVENWQGNKNIVNINTFVSQSDYQCDIIKISAKQQNGLEELKAALLDAEKELFPNADSTFVTNVRHYEALRETASALCDVRTSLASGVSSDLVAEDLRRSLSGINSILGTDLLDPETILHSIFSRHCIGK